MSAPQKSTSDRAKAKTTPPLSVVTADKGAAVRPPSPAPTCSGTRTWSRDAHDWMLLLAVIVGLLLPSTAKAQTPAVDAELPVVAVIAFEGPQGKRLHQETIKALSKAPWDKRLTVTTGDDATVFIYGTVKRARKRLSLSITVSSVTDEDVIAEFNATGNRRALSRAIANKLPTNLIDGIEAAHIRTRTAIAYDREQVAASSAVLEEEPEPAISTPASSSPEQVNDNDVLVLEVAAQVFSRELSYTDDLYQQLYGYQLPLGPALGTHIQWYPGARGGGLLAHIGLIGDARLAIGINSDGESSHPTSAWGAQAGVRGRVPLGSVELGLIGTYGLDTFSFEDDAQGVAAPAPDTSYQYARLGFDSALSLGTLTLSAGYSYRLVLDSGEIAETNWFPRSEASGAEASVGFGYQVSEQLNLGLNLEWRRYAFTMNPEPGDALIAGGALDETLTGAVSVGWQL